MLDKNKYPTLSEFMGHGAERTQAAEPEELEQETAADPTPYLTAFEMDSKVEKFISKFKLKGEIEEVEGGEENMYRIKQDVAQKLAKTHKLFIEGQYAEERKKGMDQDIIEFVQGVVKEVAPDLGDVKVEVSERQSNYGNPAHWYSVSISKGAFEQQLDILYYTYEPWVQVREAAESWSWAAWLGVEDSPFFDSDFCDAYDHDWISIAHDEMFATLKQSQDYWDIKDAIKELDNEYEAYYFYVVDLDERGSFRSHVEDDNGKTVFELSNEKSEDDGYEDGALWIVEDGFMKHANDIAGLEKYLKDTEILPKKSSLMHDRDR